VRSYFLESRWIDAKTGSLARDIADLETIVVGNEREALALEHNLIKQYRPKFNVVLRDDKTYPYIKFTAAEKYPRVYFTRVSKRRVTLFRPYFPSSLARRILHFVHSGSSFFLHGGPDAQPPEACCSITSSGVSGHAWPGSRGTNAMRSRAQCVCFSKGERHDLIKILKSGWRQGRRRSCSKGRPLTAICCGRWKTSKSGSASPRRREMTPTCLLITPNRRSWRRTFFTCAALVLWIAANSMGRTGRI